MRCTVSEGCLDPACRVMGIFQLMTHLLVHWFYKSRLQMLRKFRGTGFLRGLAQELRGAFLLCSQWITWWLGARLVVNISGYGTHLPLAKTGF